MRVFIYGLVGLVVGGLFGVLLGGGQLRQMNKTERALAGGIASWTWTIFGAIGGAVILGSLGAKIEEDERLENLRKQEEVRRNEVKRVERLRIAEIKRHLGLLPDPSPEIFKDGRYSVGISKWIDPRNGEEYILKTHRNASGKLVTTLGRYIYEHTATSANTDVVPAVHRSTKEEIFKKLIKA